MTAAGRATSKRAALRAIDAIDPLKLRTGLPVWLADGARAPAPRGRGA
jgi:hypothetical protein